MIIEFYCCYGLIIMYNVPEDLQVNRRKLRTWFEMGVKAGYVKRARKLSGFRSKKTNKWINRYMVDFNDVSEEWRKELLVYLDIGEEWKKELPV